MKIGNWHFKLVAKRVGPTPSQDLTELATYCNKLEDRILVLEQSFSRLAATQDTARQQGEAEAVPGVTGQRLPNVYLDK